MVDGLDGVYWIKFIYKGTVPAWWENNGNLVMRFWEILVSGGKFWNFEERCVFFFVLEITSTHITVGNLTLFVGRTHFF